MNRNKYLIVTTIEQIQYYGLNVLPRFRDKIQSKKDISVVFIYSRYDTIAIEFSVYF